MIKFLFYTNNQTINKNAIIVIVMAIISGIAASVIATIITYTAELVISNSSTSIYINLQYFMLIFVILFFSKQISLKYGIMLVEQSLEHYRNMFCNNLRQSTLIEIEQLDQGEIYTKFSIDTKKISRASLSGIRTIQGIVTIICVIIYVCFFSFLAGCVFFFFFALGYFYYKLQYAMIIQTIETMAQKETELFDDVGHILDGFKELKLNYDKNNDFFSEYVLPLMIKVKELRIAIGDKYVDISVFCFYLLLHMAIGSIVFFMPVEYSVASRFKIITLSAFLWEPINIVFSAIPEILLAKVSIDRLENMMQSIQFTQESQEYIFKEDKSIHTFNQLIVDNIEFSYTDNNGSQGFNVGPIQLDIHAGEIIFLVGGNGSGKSTLLKLISGLYTLSKGKFRLNESDVDISDYRHFFSVVFSDCHLFEKPFGVPNISDKTVNDWLQQMEITHVVKWENQQFKYSGLSTGQKKRLALITALLEDRPILILDEWAAEQDPEFKRKFYEELLPMFKNDYKTVIVATHDKKYYSVADKIVHMQYGKIVEKGLY